KAMAEAGTVAVLLPGAFYFLKETQKPPIEMFRKLKVPIAVATDCNPGTSPALSLRLMMNMACTLFGLTPDEALTGVTLNAAKALGLDQELGSLEVGKTASIALWDTDNPAALCYWLGGNLLEALYLDGQPVIASA
ncbi:MAG: amidohydrolase family protein, partial [Proteobacteria bacterium]|nr:amidohydrolase family protein [Pseudomonadota bacterium]